MQNLSGLELGWLVSNNNIRKLMLWKQKFISKTKFHAEWALENFKNWINNSNHT